MISWLTCLRCESALGARAFRPREAIAGGSPAVPGRQAAPLASYRTTKGAHHAPSVRVVSFDAAGLDPRNCPIDAEATQRAACDQQPSRPWDERAGARHAGAAS